jgi:MoaA/NifB/PqqE/SkfB family radical SAM enzyme
MMTDRKLYPTTSGVSVRDLGSALMPLARNIASIQAPALRARNPSFATWTVTKACNLGCNHCSMNRPDPDELTHAGRLEVAHRLARSTVWGVSLIGGEPLLVKGLFDYARIIKSGGKRLFLGTSGDRLGSCIDQIFDVGIDVVTISAEGNTAETHDAFRHRTGLFGRILQSIEVIAARRHRDQPRIQIRCTMNRLNFREIGNILAFWREYADNVLLQVIQDNVLHQVRDRSCLFQPADRPEFERAYAELRARHPFLRGRYYDELPRYIFEPDALYKDLGFRCLLVPATMIDVWPSGKVKLCGGVDSEIGSIMETPLEDLWRGDRAALVRTKMQSKEFGCMCWESAYARNLDLIEMNRYYESVADGVKSILGRRSAASEEGIPKS